MDSMLKASAVERRLGRVTRFDAYREALKFIEEAVGALDQACACLRDAKCDDITGRVGGYRADARAVTGIVVAFLMATQVAECDDCDKPLAECGCTWLREPIDKVVA